MQYIYTFLVFFARSKAMLPIPEPLEPSLPLSDWALEPAQSTEGREDELAITSFWTNKYILKSSYG